MNKKVTTFLNGLQHPFRPQIDSLREIILAAAPGMKEIIKWNAPNYTIDGQDRITIRVNPPKSFSLILHMGAKVQAPVDKPMIDDHGILV